MGATDDFERRNPRAKAVALINLVGVTHDRVRDTRTGDLLVAPPVFISFLLSFSADSFPRSEKALRDILLTTATAHRVALPKFVAVSYFMPCTFFVVGYRSDWKRTQQLHSSLKVGLSEFSFFAGVLIAHADNIRDAAWRCFSGEPLVASLRAGSKGRV